LTETEKKLITALIRGFGYIVALLKEIRKGEDV